MWTNPSQTLLKAKLENIVIVPASILTLKDTLQELVHSLPQGAVFLCHAAENTRQRKLLERVEETFREQGHTVMNLSVREGYTQT